MQLFRAAFKRAAVVFVSGLLIAAVGCGTGGGFVLINPTGNFSNASLKGSYAYVIRGGFPDSSGNNIPYREVGVFTADGAGNIGKTTPGSDDANGSTTAAPVTGTYKIAGDGTGSIAMTSQFGPINLAVTLVSSSKLYLMEADPGVAAVGTAELQDSSAIGSTPTGTFVFGIHQEIAQSGVSASEVGFVSLSGGTGNGAMDENDGGAVTSPNITVVFNAPGALGRGTGSLTDTTSNSVSNFVYYIVNSGKLNLLISDANAVGSGSAEAQTGAVANGLSGHFAFGSEGDDASYFNGFAAVGQFTTTAASISGTEDVMQDGSLTANSPISSCANAASANGRVVVTNGSGTPCSGNATSVFYLVNPSRAFFLDLSSNSVDDGTADAQATAPFSASTFNGQFALGMGGIDLTVQQLGIGLADQSLSRVGTLQFDGSDKLTLNEVANASFTGSGAASPGVLAGNYSVSSNGRITGSIANGGNLPLDLVMYGVSASKAYVMQTDGGLITSGMVELQQ